MPFAGGPAANMQEESVARSIFEAAMRMHDSLDASDVVARALEVLPRLVDAHSWAVFMKTEHSSRLELVRAVNAAEVPAGAFVEIERAPIPIARAVSEHRNIVSGPDGSG